MCIHGFDSEINATKIFNVCVQGSGSLLELCQNAEQGYNGEPYQPVEMPPGFRCTLFRERYLNICKEMT